MDITTTEYLIGGAIGVLALIQLLYLYIIYNAPHRHCVAERKGAFVPSGHQPGMSVVIAASDQEALLAKHLPLILQQDYPDFEVIVVDDNSKDDTKELLERLSCLPVLLMILYILIIYFIKNSCITQKTTRFKNEWSFDFTY